MLSLFWLCPLSIRVGEKGYFAGNQSFASHLHWDLYTEKKNGSGEQLSEIKCSRYGTTLEDFGEQKLGMTKGVFWTEPDALLVRMHICPKCGKLELTAVEQTDAILLSRKGLKKCVKCGERIPLASLQCKFCGAEQSKQRDE